MKVYFIGAGPGDPELITIKGKLLIENADLIIYAGSLVNPKLFQFARPGIPVYDSAKMDLEKVTAMYDRNKNTDGIIARLHTGDPSIYGAIQEQIDFCRTKEIPFEVVPGVSSFFAAAAELRQEFTLPGVSQTLILTRIAGRTPVPESEDLAELAKHRASMVVFLSALKIEEVKEKLLQEYPPDTPVSVVYRASWPDQVIINGTLDTICRKTKEAGITQQALVVIGDVLRAQTESGVYDKSKLYDPSFSHGHRTAAVNRNGGNIEKETQAD